MLGPPLRELATRPRLLWGVHLAYFGLYVLGAIIIYQLPMLQTVMMAAVGQAIGGGKGPLAVAGAAYGSGNMLYAAVVTFLINFPLGSFAMISLPSMIVPGCGSLLAAFRATLWGLLLGPSEAASGLGHARPHRHAAPRGRGLHPGHVLRPAGPGLPSETGTGRGEACGG